MLIKIRDMAKKLIIIQILYNCIIKFCIGHLNVPSVANYLTDVITVLLCFLLLYDCHFKIKFDKMKLIFFGFTLSVAISFCLNSYSVVLYLWGIRNIFRFFAFFFACVHFLELTDIRLIMDYLEKIFWVNIIIILVQKWILNYIGDASSGLYSLAKEGGGNGAVNILLCVVCAYELAKYMVGEIKATKFVIYLVSTCIVAVSIELKVFFVECIILLALYIIVRKISVKGIFMLGFSIIVIIWGTKYLEKLYPLWEGFFTISELIENTMTYGDSEKVGRLTGMLYIMGKILQTPTQRLFGIGLGNADFSSSFTFLTSDFYRKYEFLSYNFFSSAWMLLETGICGTICYLLWFANSFLHVWKLRNKKNIWIYFSIFASVITIIQFFYNQMLRVETAGYLAQFCLAVGFIYSRSQKILKE